MRKLMLFTIGFIISCAIGMYLCNPDQKMIDTINGRDRHMVLRFNDLSGFTFTVPKEINSEKTYEMIETKRLVYVEEIGWFQITSVVENIEGGKFSKSVTAESHQTIFKNRGFVTENRVYMFYNPNDPLDEQYDDSNPKAIPSVVGQLNKQLGIRVELEPKDTIQTEDKTEWTIVYIDPSLKFISRSYSAMYEGADGVDNICRTFEENTELFGYDFIINNVETAFNIIFEFDFLHHTISIKKLDDATEPTDIYLSFDNVLKTMNVTENADNIVTVLSCKGNELDIRTVNPMGTNYICDFSFYKKEKSADGKIDYPWMSKALISTLDEWEAEFEKWQKHDDERGEHPYGYAELTEKIQPYYEEQLEFANLMQSSNLQLQDLIVARDQYLAKTATTKDETHKEDGEEWTGSASIVVEAITEKQGSLAENSAYYKTPFIYGNINTTITAYQSAPKVVKNDDGSFYFSFSDIDSKEGSLDELISEYMREEDLQENQILENVYLYFNDTGNNPDSYCKFNVMSEIDVAKDNEGVIVSFQQKVGEEWSTKNGKATVKGMEFEITRETPTSELIVSCGDNFTLVTWGNQYFDCNGKRFYISVSADGIVSIYFFYINGFDRYTTYSKLAGENGWCLLWENFINGELRERNEVCNQAIESISSEMAYINEQCNIQKFVLAKGEDIYNELLNYWIEGTYTNDSLAVLETTTMKETIDLAKELMLGAQKDLAKSARPRLTLTVESVNFLKLEEFKKFAEQLGLGKTITIEKMEGVIYTPSLIALDYDLDYPDPFTFTFSESVESDETMMTYAELIKETSSVTRTVTSNWSNLISYAKNKENIDDMINSPLDRTLRAAKENMFLQEFIVDDTGILGRKYIDEVKDKFSPKQIRIINNTILFTQDNWKTASLALGEVKYGESGEEAYGLIADVLVGNLILSKQMVISSGDEGNYIKLNENGISIYKNSEKVFYADDEGDLHLEGTIIANRGKIGVLEIDEDGSIKGSHFSVSASGVMIATSGKIGGLTIEEDGSLATNNFRINNTSNANDGRTETFIELSGTKITREGIVTKQIQTDSMSVKNNIVTSGSLYGGGFIFNNNKIQACGQTIEFTTGGGSVTYTVTITQEEKNQLLIEINKELGHTIIVSFSYVTEFADNTYSASCTFQPGGSREYRHVTNTFWGIKNPSLVALNSNSVSGTRATISFDTGSNLSFTSNLVPYGSGGYSLGTEDHKWNNIYATTGTINTSDRNEKNSIQPLDEKYSDFFDKLNPVSYKFNENTSDRLHIGFGAQDVKEAIILSGMTTKDFAGYCEWEKEDGEIGCGLRYVEFTALNTYEIQKLKKQVIELEKEIKELKNET